MIDKIGADGRRFFLTVFLGGEHIRKGFDNKKKF